MNMMPKLPGLVAPEEDKTQYDPSVLPWTVIPKHPTGKFATVFNAANEPIGTLEAHSHAHLMEMGRIIEQAFRERDELLDEVRCLREKERNLNQRRTAR